MSQYKAYPAYKDSGVEWIGQVPEHWKIAPVKYHYDARLGKMIQPAAVSDRDIEVPYHRAQTVQWERIVESDIKEMWASPRDIEQFSVSEGDLLICEGGDVCRAAIVKQPPEKNMIFQKSIHRIRSKGEYGVGWVMRLMQHLRSSEWIDVLCNKNTIVHFTSDKLGSLECPLPPPDEQASIAAALDRETARIDALIQKKTRFIELLKEKRQALITHAVTKGLDPNVKMKDSGVEWLGEVPEHWSSVPIKYMALERNSLFLDGDWIESKDISTDGIRYITTGNVGEGVYKEQGSGFISEETFHALGCTEVYGGDVLVSRLNNPIGRACMVPDLGVRVVTSVDNVIFRPDSKFNKKFIVYLFSSEEYFKHTSNLARGATMQRISRGLLGNIRVATPSIEEQTQIARFLDHETARIDALIGKAEQSITLLKERRAAFITAAVTGQIDLRGEQ